MPAVLKDDLYGLSTVQFQIVSLSPLVDVNKLGFFGFSVRRRDNNVRIVGIFMHGISSGHSGKI